MIEPTVNFTIGNLQLVLVPAFTPADIEWMRGRSQQGQTATKESLTNDEAFAFLDRCVRILIQCAREHSPEVTKKDIFRQIGTKVAQELPRIAIALFQVMGSIPTDAV